MNLRAVATSDGYSAAATLSGDQLASRVVIQVANAAVDYQFAWQPPAAWEPAERTLLPGLYSFARRAYGIRFRSHAAGTPAVVSADLFSATELAT